VKEPQHGEKGFHDGNESPRDYRGLWRFAHHKNKGDPQAAFVTEVLNAGFPRIKAGGRSLPANPSGPWSQ
jgi:hypothetical protein